MAHTSCVVCIRPCGRASLFVDLVGHPIFRCEKSDDLGWVLHITPGCIFWYLEQVLLAKMLRTISVDNRKNLLFKSSSGSLTGPIQLFDWLEEHFTKTLEQ